MEARVDDVFQEGEGEEKIEWIPFGDGIFDFARAVTTTAWSRDA